MLNALYSKNGPCVKYESPQVIEQQEGVIDIEEAMWNTKLILLSLLHSYPGGLATVRVRQEGKGLGRHLCHMPPSLRDTRWLWEQH